MAAAFPWSDASVFKSWMQNGKNITSVIVLQRDKGGGKVSCSTDGFTPKVDYYLHKDDAANVIEGMKRAFDIVRNSPGAKRIISLHALQKPFIVGESDVQAFYDQIDELGTQANGLGMFCAHQMGSCRCVR